MDAAQSAVIFLQWPRRFKSIALGERVRYPQRCRFDLRPLGLCCFVDFIAIAARTEFALRAGSPRSAPVRTGSGRPRATKQHHIPAPAPAPLAHVGLAEALPLIAVLWDLPTNPSDTKTIANSGNAPAIPTGISPASVLVQSPILTFKMGLSNDANESLPVVHAAKINYTGPQGALETQTVSKPDQLPTGLISALKEAAHTTIEGQAAGVTTTFANALFLTVTDHAAGTASSPLSIRQR